MRLIDADALYERTAEWEAQALHMVEVTMNDEDKTKWRKWSAVLAERSAFKHDIADAPTIEEQKTRQWIPCSERLPEYGESVLCYHEDDDYSVNHIIDDEDGEWFNDGVVAWMPLPEPYCRARMEAPE